MEYKKFEEALTKLEKIVDDLEKGKVSLEDALKLFEEGVKISQYCTTVLDKAERKVEILLKNDKGELEENSFNLSKEKGS